MLQLTDRFEILHIARQYHSVIIQLIGQLKRMLWMNEISRDLSLRWVSGRYPILHSTPALYLSYWIRIWMNPRTYDKWDVRAWPHWEWTDYRETSSIRRTLVGNIIVDHSGVVGASPVGVDVSMHQRQHYCDVTRKHYSDATESSTIATHGQVS